MSNEPIDSEKTIAEFVAMDKLPDANMFDSPENLALFHNQTTEERYHLSKEGLQRIRELRKAK